MVEKTMKYEHFYCVGIWWVRIRSRVMVELLNEIRVR